MSSILTNTSAMVALQTMKAINKDMGQIQNQISTGLKVATAKDNAAVWSIASTMRSDVEGYKSLRESLDLASSTVSVARSGAEAIAGLWGEIKEQFLKGGQENVDRTKIEDEIKELLKQAHAIAGAASFNGLNLIGEDAADIDVVSGFARDSEGNLTVSYIAVGGENLSDLGSLFDDGEIDDAAFAEFFNWTVDPEEDDESFAGTLQRIETALQTAIDRATALGTAERRLDIQNEFLGKLSDSLTQGIGAMVDADMEEASARLQALQVQQQLGIQSLSIANQNPQNILSLFR